MTDKQDLVQTLDEDTYYKTKIICSKLSAVLKKRVTMKDFVNLAVNQNLQKRQDVLKELFQEYQKNVSKKKKN